MFKLYRKERKGDRNRKRISTPQEQVVPTFSGGNIYVSTKSSGTARILKSKHGFLPVIETKLTPVKPKVVTPEPDFLGNRKRVQLKKLTVKELKVIAASLKIRGRSKMNEDELIEEIIKAQM